MGVLRLDREASEWREMEGEVVALDVGCSEYIATNRAGAELWRLLDSGASRADLIGALVARFGIDEPTAAADVDRFLGSLRARNLLVE
jgi:hypothetical protein